jgi:hypothetical protein
MRRATTITRTTRGRMYPDQVGKGNDSVTALLIKATSMSLDVETPL